MFGKKKSDEKDQNESKIKSAAEIAAERSAAAIDDIEVQESEANEAAESFAAQSAPRDQEAQKLRGELESIKDKYLRLNAEFDNFRKRNAKERIELIGSANEQLIAELLPVLDNFARAVEHAPEGLNENFLQGITLIEKQFAEILKRQGLDSIPAEGQIFDPNLHEAMMTQPSEDHTEGTIIQEIERGYTFKGKVVRASRVIVSSGGPNVGGNAVKTAEGES